jgi:hypothetical protein
MRFSAAERAGILAEARAHLNKRPTGPREREATTSAPQSDLVFKAIDDAIVRAPTEHRTAAGSSEFPWQEWVDRRIDATITAAEQDMGKVLGKELDAIQPALQLMQRELATLRDEVRVLREQLGLSRELASLRSDIEQARAEVPKLPAIAARLEAGQARLERELEATKSRVTRMRTNQILADGRLAELRKETATRTAEFEVKLETASVTLRQMNPHPTAAEAMADFAHATLKAAPKWAPSPETLWIFDPNVRSHGSSHEAA